MDLTSLTDPMVKVWLREEKNPDWTFHGQTEIIKNNLDPDFKESFTLSYYFEKQQLIKFEVYNEDNDNQFEIVGIHETTFAKIMSAPKQILSAKLELPGQQNPGKKSRGKIIVKAESVGDSNNEVILEIEA
mmetsp:Transcript_807/g.1443  ORF Transcript_807/g.1443 Transcript_807/m.1443 type:complete len:131 (-) Transcript_807:57-449(-)